MVFLEDDEHQNIADMNKVKELFELIKETIQEWQADKVSRLAAALSFFAALSIPSILVLAITIAGQVVGTATAQKVLLSQIDQYMGQSAQQAIGTILNEASRPNSFSLRAIISILLLFFGASGVFVQLQDAMNKVWNVKSDPEKSLMNTIQDRAFSFAMVIGIGILLVVILLANSLMTMLGQTLNNLLPGTFAWVRVLNYLTSFFMLAGLLILVFKVIPDIQVDWKDVTVGAVVTAVLFFLGVIAISQYFRISDPTSSYGAAGSLMAMLLWIYYSAQIVFMGAEFTQVYTNRYGGSVLPKEGAVWITPPQQDLHRESLTAQAD